MGGIRKLAGQTLWYGVPTIASRFLSYALSIALFHLYKPLDTAPVTQLYAVIPFLTVLYTYGMETSYFRFVKDFTHKHVFNTLMSSLLISTILLSILIAILSEWLAVQFLLPTEFIYWAIAILVFDTLASLPFAKLRQENRPRRYAFIKVVNVLSTVLLVFYYLGICPAIYAQDPESIWLILYNPEIGIGYYVIANVVASCFTFLLLFKEWRTYRFDVDWQLWKRVINYSYPLVIVGLGGMINEMLSRLVYTNVVDLSPAEAQYQLGVFGANYKVAVLITIFIQVFKMAAEPFFFQQSKQDDAKKTYARVMKFFVIIVCTMWLMIVTHLPLIQYLAYGSNASDYAEGLGIIPILAMGSVFLGIYYNLSIWYKLTDQTMMGAWITIAGAIITIALNIWWIPIFGYTGSAWATFVCYLVMMIASYVLGQRNYPVPYAWKKLVAYMVIIAVLYIIFLGSTNFKIALPLQLLIGWILIGAWVFFISKIERKELTHLLKKKG